MPRELICTCLALLFVTHLATSAIVEDTDDASDGLGLLSARAIRKGLRVLVYVNVSDYLPTSDAAGIQVAVHGKTETPFPDAYGSSIPLGSLTSLGISRRSYIRLPKPYGKCYDQDKVGLPNGYIFDNYDYSVEGCYRSCFQQQLIQRCACGDPRFPVPPGNQTCSPEDPAGRWWCSGSGNDKGSSQTCLGKCLEDQLELLLGSLSDCECLQPCDEIAYSTSFSTAVWPSGAAKVGDCRYGDLLCQEKYRKNAAQIQVFYQQLNYEVFEETPTYTFVNLLADFGGTLGLWLGISVVTTLELVILSYNMLLAYMGYEPQMAAAQPQPVIIYKPAVKDSSTEAMIPEEDDGDDDEEPPPAPEAELIADWILSLDRIDDPDFKRLILKLRQLADEEENT